MQVHFVARENCPERLVTEAQIHVTFPSRAFGAGSERRYPGDQRRR